nr:hypothetical protein F29G9.7 - Caenorhabditis elegans [Caenorhabditis elegans]
MPEYVPTLNFNFNSTSSIFKRSVKFGDLRLPIKYDPETAYTCSTDNYEDCLQPCLDLFATIFSCRGGIAIVNLNECSLNVREHTAHRIFNKNLVVKLCGDVQNLGTNNGSLQSFYPEYVLLEGIVADFHFLEEEFDPYEMFTRNRVSIMDAKWVTLYHLKSLKFIWLVLYNSMLTERDVNEFIKLWLDGKWLQLHRFEIRHTSRGGFDLEVLKSGLNVKKWNKNLRNGCYIVLASLESIISKKTISSSKMRRIVRARALLFLGERSDHALSTQPPPPIKFVILSYSPSQTVQWKPSVVSSVICRKKRQEQPTFERLLQLPPPAFANILKILGAVKILELSQLSKRMCTLIQAANITFDHIMIAFSESSALPIIPKSVAMLQTLNLAYQPAAGISSTFSCIMCRAPQNGELSLNKTILTITLW